MTKKVVRETIIREFERPAFKVGTTHHMKDIAEGEYVVIQDSRRTVTPLRLSQMSYAPLYSDGPEGPESSGAFTVTISGWSNGPPCVEPVRDTTRPSTAVSGSAFTPRYLVRDGVGEWHIAYPGVARKPDDDNRIALAWFGVVDRGLIAYDDETDVMELPE